MATPEFKHPLYKKHEDQLSRVSNIYSGVDSAKQYLQRYSQEDEAEYNARKDIATLDNFVFRTVDDTKNIIFRKPLDDTGITNNDVILYSNKIDLTNTLNEFAKKALSNRIRDGFTFVLVDSVAYDSNAITNKAQQTALGIRPYFVNILRQNVLSWKTDDNGIYTQVVIQEPYTVELDYSIVTLTQLKIWTVRDGKVEIEIWRENKKEYEKVSITQTALKSIPIVKIGDNNIPPLYDLAKINITHMNRDSEVSNYARVGGAAFLAVFGAMDDGNAPKTLGINNGMRFNDKSQSDVKWIEMEGRNYEMLKSRISYHEEQMNRISSAFTMDQTQEKTAYQVGKETMTGESKAIDYATQLEDGINTALKLLDVYKTEGSYGDNIVEVNKDYDSAILSPEMVASYRLDYTSGIISYEKLIEYLVAGEYFKSMTDEELAVEKARLADSGMGL